MKLAKHLDFLTISYQTIKNIDEMPFDGTPFQPCDIAHPFTHYDLAYKLECGGTFNISNNKKQGCRLDLTGDNLLYLRGKGWDCDRILRHLSTPLKKRTTRIDYAWTIENEGSVRHIVNHYKAGKCVTRFRAEPQIVCKPKSRKGWSVWFGKGNPQQLIVYDKGAELKLKNAKLLRIEFRAKDEFAQALFEDSLEGGIEKAARSRLLGMIDFPKLQLWKRALQGYKMETSTIARKQSKFKKWLGADIAQTIITHYERDKDNEADFIDEWLSEMTMRLAQIKALRLE